MRRPAAFAAKCNEWTGLSGVYLLVDNGTIVYVGSSTQVEYRLWAHRRPSDSGLIYSKVFDGAFWYALPLAVHPHYEGAFIRALRPAYNRSAPPHVGYDNEILDGFGLPVHDDEYANAAALSRRPVGCVRHELAILIKSWRASLRLTQKRLGQWLGVSDACVSYWESGDTTPTTGNLALLASVAGVSMSEFWAGPVSP